MRTTQLKELAFYIERLRQQLEHAIRTHDEPTAARLSVGLAELHSAYFDASIQSLNLQVTDALLVFSDLFPDGVVMSSHDYAALITHMNGTDLQTHTVVPVDASMALQVAETLEQLKKSAS